MELLLFCLLLYFSSLRADPCENRLRTAFPHGEDCSKYYFCRRGVQTVGKCSDGLSFDVQTNACRDASLAKCKQLHETVTPLCNTSITTDKPWSICNDTSKIQVFPDLENCQSYFICIWGDKVQKKCLNNYYFSYTKLICLPKEKAECKKTVPSNDIMNTPMELNVDNISINEASNTSGIYDNNQLETVNNDSSSESTKHTPSIIEKPSKLSIVYSTIKTDSLNNHDLQPNTVEDNTVSSTVASQNEKTTEKPILTTSIPVGEIAVELSTTTLLSLLKFNKISGVESDTTTEYISKTDLEYTSPEESRKIDRLEVENKINMSNTTVPIDYNNDTESNLITIESTVVEENTTVILIGGDSSTMNTANEVTTKIPDFVSGKALVTTLETTEESSSNVGLETILKESTSISGTMDNSVTSTKSMDNIEEASTAVSSPIAEGTLSLTDLLNVVSEALFASVIGTENIAVSPEKSTSYIEGDATSETKPIKEDFITTESIYSTNSITMAPESKISVGEDVATVSSESVTIAENNSTSTSEGISVSPIETNTNMRDASSILSESAISTEAFSATSLGKATYIEDIPVSSTKPTHAPENISNTPIIPNIVTHVMSFTPLKLSTLRERVFDTSETNMTAESINNDLLIANIGSNPAIELGITTNRNNVTSVPTESTIPEKSISITSTIPYSDSDFMAVTTLKSNGLSDEDQLPIPETIIAGLPETQRLATSALDTKTDNRTISYTKANAQFEPITGTSNIVLSNVPTSTSTDNVSDKSNTEENLLVSLNNITNSKDMLTTSDPILKTENILHAPKEMNAISEVVITIPSYTTTESRMPITQKKEEENAIASTIDEEVFTTSLQPTSSGEVVSVTDIETKLEEGTSTVRANSNIDLTVVGADISSLSNTEITSYQFTETSSAIEELSTSVAQPVISAGGTPMIHITSTIATNGDPTGPTNEEPRKSSESSQNNLFIETVESTTVVYNSSDYHSNTNTVILNNVLEKGTDSNELKLIPNVTTEDKIVTSQSAIDTDSITSIPLQVDLSPEREAVNIEENEKGGAIIPIEFTMKDLHAETLTSPLDLIVDVNKLHGIDGSTVLPIDDSRRVNDIAVEPVEITAVSDQSDSITDVPIHDMELNTQSELIKDVAISTNEYKTPSGNSLTNQSEPSADSESLNIRLLEGSKTEKENFKSSTSTKDFIIAPSKFSAIKEYTSHELKEHSTNTESVSDKALELNTGEEIPIITSDNTPKSETFDSISTTTLEYSTRSEDILNKVSYFGTIKDIAISPSETNENLTESNTSPGISINTAHDDVTNDESIILSNSNNTATGISATSLENYNDPKHASNNALDVNNNTDDISATSPSENINKPENISNKALENIKETKCESMSPIESTNTIYAAAIPPSESAYRSEDVSTANNDTTEVSTIPIVFTTQKDSLSIDSKVIKKELKPALDFITEVPITTASTETDLQTFISKIKDKLQDECDVYSVWAKSDSTSSRYYFLCLYGDLTHRKCPEDFEFDPIVLMCLPPSQSKCNSICKSHGIYFSANPADETKYYICFNKTPIPQKCPHKFVFDAKIMKCTTTAQCFTET